MKIHFNVEFKVSLTVFQLTKSLPKNIFGTWLKYRFNNLVLWYHISIYELFWNLVPFPKENGISPEFKIQKEILIGKGKS